MCKGLVSLPACCLERCIHFYEKTDSLHYVLEDQVLHMHECLKWKESFERLLSNGLCAFTAFLVSEFSEENIAFYFACEDYRRTKCPTKLLTKAQKIYSEFISSEAPREVNIDHETRDITKANLMNPSPSCFDQAQHRIYMLMAKDCYPRFLHSPVYRDLLCQAKPSTKLTNLPHLVKKV
uniref:Regulator of G protein signaling 16 n=1 Tax=Xiphophorus couchianus TaxID=32473 RepID=A0A3B5L4D7_9TELE